MKLTRKLAKSQLKTNKSRTFWTLAGIALSTAMITAVFGFAASGDAMFKEYIGDNEFYLNEYLTMLYGISTVFISIIIIASVIVVSNSFRVSAGERISQFGILKSVGATRRQITETIMHEGILLCAIGVPAGIALGLLVNVAGTHIVGYYLTSLNATMNTTLELNFVFSWQAIILSAVCSFATVCLSAWLPAHKAAKIPAIDAIRGAGEVKIEAKKVRSSWLVKKLFGFEGTLASKSLKRSRRNFRATVVSLTVSVILFILVGTFGFMMRSLTTVFFPGVEANAVAEFYTSNHVSWSDEGEVIERRYTSLESDAANEITQKLREFPDTEIIGVGNDIHSFRAAVPEEMLTPKMYELLSPHFPPEGAQEFQSATLLVTDDETYAKLCGLAGVPVGSNILINQHTWYYPEGGRTVLVPLVFDNQTLQFQNRYNNEEFELTLDGELTIGEIPSEILLYAGNMLSIIVPQLETLAYRWLATTEDAYGFTDYANTVLKDSVVTEEHVSRVSVMNIDEHVGANRDLGRLIMVFIYGFIIMLTLIGLTNVISTISTNVRSRSREFAILRSVGMTQRGLSHMLNLESILCSVKSLLIGVPLGIAGAYLIYTYLSAPAEFSFNLPWVPIIQCMLGVFAVTWVTMRYSASRLRNKNIVETIRGME